VSVDIVLVRVSVDIVLVRVSVDIVLVMMSVDIVLVRVSVEIVLVRVSVEIVNVLSVTCYQQVRSHVPLLQYHAVTRYFDRSVLSALHFVLQTSTLFSL